MLSLGVLIIELILAEELTLSQCRLEIQSLNNRLSRLEQMYEENSKDIQFLIDENSQIRDKLDSANKDSQVRPCNADVNDEKDGSDEIYSQFIGSNENCLSMSIYFKTSRRISTN